MKKIAAVSFLVFSFLLALSPKQSAAQDLTGIWKGYFISDGGDYYKLEFQVSQNNGYGVTGVSYSYLDIRFYGKATMTGNFIKNSGSFRIREIKTVEVKSSMGGATCIMNYNFKYSRSGKEEFLEGTYLGKFEGAYARPEPQWGDCGGGKVYLRKVTESDFYVEPFLRNKLKTNQTKRPVIINQPPVKKDSAKKITTNKPPVTTKPVPTTKPVTTKKPPVTNNKPVVTTKPTVKPTTKPVTKTDTAKVKVTNQVVKTNPVLPPKPQILKTRVNELAKSLTVPSSSVTVKIYDNGEIDDDTISVYYDNRLVLSSKRLTATPLVVKLELTDQDTDHELVMVAENLGRIPPNTSLMIVESGGQRFEVRITSTEQKNAVVRFRYKQPQ